MKIPVTLLLSVFLFAMNCSSADLKHPSLDELIPEAQQQASGLKKLTADEREALRQHIVSLLAASSVRFGTTEANKSATGHRQSASIAVATNGPFGLSDFVLPELTNTATEALAKKVSAGKRTRTRIPVGSSGGVYAGGSSGHWIQENMANGKYLTLEDGSLWEVDPLDVIDTSLWLAISSIRVVPSSGSPGYDYLLLNTDDGEKAHAKFISE